MNEPRGQANALDSEAEEDDEIVEPASAADIDLDKIAEEEAEEAAEWAAREAARLADEAEWNTQEAKRLRETHAAGPVVQAVLYSRLGAYATTQVHRVGEVADLVLANGRGLHGHAVNKRCLLKIARDASDNDLLDNEARVLAQLQTPMDEKSVFFRKYLPKLQDSFAVEGRRVNVMDLADGYVSLADVHAAYPKGIHLLDAVWMLRRSFEVLGWVHAQGYVHGAVLPEHVLVHPDSHNAKLVGWSYAVRSGSAMSAVSALHKDMYPDAILRRSQATPALDIAMAVDTACGLLSDEKGRMADVPEPLRQFFSKCGWMGVRDGWTAYREYNDILKQLYGERRYRKFAMPS